MQELYADIEVSSPRGFNVDVLAQVHDSILMQVPIAAIKDRARFEWLRERIRQATSPTLRYNNRDFKIASDYKFGLNWGEHNEHKNPGGMQEFEDFDSFLKAIEAWGVSDGTGTEGLAGELSRLH
jgi:hypothetical protein